MKTMAQPKFLQQTHFAADETEMFVTMRVDEQLFGIPVLHVRDVFREQRVAHVPLAAPEVLGSINLRGRIVTVIDLRQRLRLKPREKNQPSMFVVTEHKNEYYSLMVDSVGEVLTIPTAQIEAVPANLSSNWRDVASGVSRLQNELIVAINIHMLLTF